MIHINEGVRQLRGATGSLLRGSIMASVMMECGLTTDTGLIAAGFTEGEVDECAADARDLAARRSKEFLSLLEAGRDGPDSHPMMVIISDGLIDDAQRLLGGLDLSRPVLEMVASGSYRGAFLTWAEEVGMQGGDWLSLITTLRFLNLNPPSSRLSAEAVADVRSKFLGIR
jgi:hypothetical protein